MISPVAPSDFKVNFAPDSTPDFALDSALPAPAA